MSISIKLEPICPRLNCCRSYMMNKGQRHGREREGELHCEYQGERKIMKGKSSLELDLKEGPRKPACKRHSSKYHAVMLSICNTDSEAVFQLSPRASYPSRSQPALRCTPRTSRLAMRGRMDPTRDAGTHGVLFQ